MYNTPNLDLDGLRQEQTTVGFTLVMNKNLKPQQAQARQTWRVDDWKKHSPQAMVVNSGYLSSRSLLLSLNNSCHSSLSALIIKLYPPTELDPPTYWMFFFVCLFLSLVFVSSCVNSNIQGDQFLKC